MKSKYSFNKILRLLLPGVVAFAVNCFCYLSPKIIVGPDKYIHLNLPLDDRIPFVPVFIIIYVVSYLQWLNYFLQACLKEDEIKYDYMMTDVIVKAICFLFFVFWPVTIDWPQIPENSGFILWLVKFIYGHDTPSCLFPSVHCVYSWMSFRLSLEKEPKERRWICALQFVFSLLVFASVVLVKQHLLIDIFGAVILTETVLQIVRRNHLGRHFRVFCDKLSSLIFRN